METAENWTNAADAKRKVLVVDDDLGILEALRFMLESSGYEVETQPRGDEVLKSVQSFRPDVILLDLYLSGFDGRDIAKELKRGDSTRSIPIIMISAHPNAGESLKQIAVDDFLPKPFDISQLLSCIERHASPKAAA